jgi:hypothetical protein
MAEFLEATIQRATAFMRLLQQQEGAMGSGVADLSTDMHNLVGHALDRFRNEGTAQLADKHIGKDPFAAPPAPAAPATAAPATTSASPPKQAAGGAAPQPNDPPMHGKIAELLTSRAGKDPETLKRTLKALYQAGVLSEDEARDLYRARMTS